MDVQAAGGMPELFISDIHGEFEPFSHAVRSACGFIRGQVDELFCDLSETQRASLACDVYYPEQRLVAHTPDYARIAALLAHVAQVRGRQADASLAADAEGAIDQCRQIQRLAVGRLHVVGDVYDRGPQPDLVMDELAAWPDLDIQWGNHDVLWMGASLGQVGCIANAVRICARYGNLSILEDTYGIDLSPLYDFALSAYADDPCVAFGLKGNPDLASDQIERSIKVQKAMAYIQFKVEHMLITENPSFGLEKRDLLDKIDFEAGTVLIDGVVHPLTDTVFPTIIPEDPYQLTPGEQGVIDYLQQAFLGCERLQRHIHVFLDKGSLYSVSGNALLFHACVPLNPDGTLKEARIFGETLKGKALFDAVDGYVRDAFLAQGESRKRGLDLLWYLWLGECSPLFAKSKMATFELYLVSDKAARKEAKNAFYTLYDNPSVMAEIFEDFGMDPATARIVCGHVPVKVKDGEDPVKCGGKVVIIDGGMSRAYQSTTGIAGFALRNGEAGWRLGTLAPFEGREAAIERNAELSISWREL